ncbi:MAG: iron-containing alcohol dehydrogenase [Prevotella sp.]|nr:iron-containing alcohol dehydrogenase [Prevotella sp.]
MNLIQKIYCRTYQWVFRAILPVLPYREPQLLATNQAIVDVLRQHQKTSVLLVTDHGIRNLHLTQSLEDTLTANGFQLTVYDDTVPNPTTDNVAAALKLYQDYHCDCIIAFGGGSAMDCAKATGARVACPKKSLAQMKGILKVGKKIPLLIAIPTTAGTGSETTLAAVITDSTTRHKYAINDFPLIPRYAALLPELTLGLPPQITATTGMDALTHAVEAYIGRSTTKHTRTYAKRAVKTIFAYLPVVYQDGSNLDARAKMLGAAYDAGVAFTQSYVGYVHAVAHSLGGKYNIPHGLANAVILPYVLRQYGRKIDRKLWELGVAAELFDRTTPYAVGAKWFIQKIEDMNRAMNIPTSIPEIDPADIPVLARTAAKEANPLYPVPVLWTTKELTQIYQEVKNG